MAAMNIIEFKYKLYTL